MTRSLPVFFVIFFLGCSGAQSVDHCAKGEKALDAKGNDLKKAAQLDPSLKD